MSRTIATDRTVACATIGESEAAVCPPAASEDGELLGCFKYVVA